MAQGRASLATIVALLLFSAFTFGAEIISDAGNLLIRPDGTYDYNVGILVISGDHLTIHAGGAVLATTFFRGGLEGKSIEEQFRDARSAILAYRGPTRRELQEAAEDCERGTVGPTPWAVVLSRSIIADQSSTTITTDLSGRVENISAEETSVTLVKAISIQYGVQCWCYEGPCICYKFLGIRVTIMTDRGPCVFTTTMHIGPAVPCS